MFGAEVVVTMLVLRVIIPVGLLLWVGETVRRRNVAEFRRLSG